MNNIKQQNEYIDKVLNDVDELYKKSQQTDYTPTDYEITKFWKIVHLVEDMKVWFQEGD